MNDKGVQVAIGSKRRETSAGGETETTSQIKTEDRGTQCGTVVLWCYDDLVARMQDKELFVYWLVEEGLLAKERLCPICAGKMSLSRCEDRSDGFKWECRKQVNFKKHRAELSIPKDSWFEKSRMTLEEILKLTLELVVPGSRSETN